MSLYELLLFVHVLAAIAWVGGALAVLVVLELAKRSGDRLHAIRALHYDDRMGLLYYVPAAVVVLVAGIGLVFEGPWGFGDGWVAAGLALLIAAMAVGVVFFLPAGKRIGAAVEAHGAESDEAAAEVDRIRLIAWADFGLLVAAVFVMTTKPF